MTPSRFRNWRGALPAAGLLACSTVGAWEGLQLAAYPDPATQGPPWTICYGETKGVRLDDTKTVAECKAMLIERLEEFARGVERCVAVPLPDERFVALVSFAYNVGTRAACGSSVVRLINEGRTREGCDALLKWNRAAGVVMRGLTHRRAAERDLCLRGLA